LKIAYNISQNIKRWYVSEYGIKSTEKIKNNTGKLLYRKKIIPLHRDFFVELDTILWTKLSWIVYQSSQTIQGI
jgi:hypothetical protein